MRINFEKDFKFLFIHVITGANSFSYKISVDYYYVSRITRRQTIPKLEIFPEENGTGGAKKGEPLENKQVRDQFTLSLFFPSLSLQQEGQEQYVALSSTK